jgi:hypothetical protein
MPKKEIQQLTGETQANPGKHSPSILKRQSPPWLHVPTQAQLGKLEEKKKFPSKRIPKDPSNIPRILPLIPSHNVGGTSSASAGVSQKGRK